MGDSETVQTRRARVEATACGSAAAGWVRGQGLLARCQGAAGVSTAEVQATTNGSEGRVEKAGAGPGH